MKLILTVISVAFLYINSHAQELSTSEVTTLEVVQPHFFGQCMLNINSEVDFAALEQQLQAIPYIQVVRVDRPTNRLFLITKDVQSFEKATLISWLGDFGAQSTCIQVGVHGIDVMNPYPFVNCQD